MAARQLQIVLRHLRKLAGAAGSGGVTDGQLLERFVTHQDESAFELLVRRHERMVWGVCRRLLTNLHDAEDAFQATFVVLVRKAATVVERESIAGWLHQVAYRIALRARPNRARIAAHEQGSSDLASAADPHDVRAEAVWRELRLSAPSACLPTWQVPCSRSARPPSKSWPGQASWSSRRCGVPWKRRPTRKCGIASRKSGTTFISRKRARSSCVRYVPSKCSNAFIMMKPVACSRNWRKEHRKPG
jgi:hypothetical protein